jgi:SAM-dependent methyltransferase
MRLTGAKQDLAEIRRRLASAEQDLNRTFKVINAIERRHYGGLPLPPEPLRLHVGTSDSAPNYWAQGISSSTRVLEVFGMSPDRPVLDWGCGSGRTLRWLLAWEPWRRHWHGCDVDAEAIAWLRSVGPFAATTCGDDPPLPYLDRTFGGLYAFSVLTHIHPDRHRAWYAELRRVLEPGGLAYVTTLGRHTITEVRKRIHGPIDRGFEKDGFVYLHNEGHYKDGAVVSEAFTRRMLDGLFHVESYVENGYGSMDAFRVRRIG